MPRVCIVLCHLAAFSSATVTEVDDLAAFSSEAVTDEDESFSCDAASFLQKDVQLHTYTASAGAAMAAKDKATLRSDPHQRVWFLCKGSPQPLSMEMQQAEIEVEDLVNCTAEMTFEGLCCAPWSTGLDFSKPVSIDLKAEQTAISDTGEASATVIKLCTEQNAGEEIAGDVPARLPVTCFEETYSDDDLLGNTTLGAGEAILRARLKFFLAQGLAMDVIPKCSEEVSVCPDGSAPAVVQDDWIEANSKPPSLLQEGEQLKFSGALFTSGSFSLSFGLF